MEITFSLIESKSPYITANFVVAKSSPTKFNSTDKLTHGKQIKSLIYLGYRCIGA